MKLNIQDDWLFKFFSLNFFFRPRTARPDMLPTLLQCTRTRSLNSQVGVGISLPPLPVNDTF